MRKNVFVIALIVFVLLGATRAVSQSLSPKTPYYQKIVSKGFDPNAIVDLSAEKNIAIDEPSCAYINITNVRNMPTTKTADMHALFECYDGNGHYFKKKIILNAQGNSSLNFVKKNFAADFCEDDWVGDKTTSISIGNWVSQDAFHFKAYYTDYFRGVATIGYKLFDDIVADHNSYLDRAGFTEYDKKARCYPDGFPCIVYLNGNYYGIFSWQLKKHRKNTNQTKDNANHIHIDGTFKNETFWKGTVSWNQFEIRNPKKLRCLTKTATSGYKYIEITDNEDELSVMGDSWVDAPCNPKDMVSEELSDLSPLYYKYVTSKGKIKYYKLTKLSGYDYAEYDGDNPSELIDETSEYFDASNQDHVRTAIVKNNILRVSGYWAELTALKNSKADSTTMRTAIAERFDVTGIIDYIVFSLVTANYDGFGKNWQWLTYDGIKWFVTPYDLDGILGNVYTGKFVMPANITWLNNDYRMLNNIGVGPAYWIRAYYWSEIVDRYEKLRSRGIFTPEHIMLYIYDWYNRLGGEDTYNSEKKKWPDSYCYNELICSPNWMTTEDWTGYSAIADYNASVTYNEGDKCRMVDRIWIATGTTTGINPYSKIGYTTQDNASRVQKWISDRIILEDSYLRYIVPLQETYDLYVSSVGEATVCVPFSFDIPAGIRLYTITGVDENNRLIREEVTTPVANKPYLVIGIPGTYTISGTYDVGDPLADDYMANGLLWGTYSTIHVPQGGYVLQANDNGGASFALVTKSNYITLGANKAYLEVPPLGRAKAGVLVDTENMATAIDGFIFTKSNTEIEGIYNASGIRTKNLNSGLNIVRYKNGETKKVIY